MKNLAILLAIVVTIPMLASGAEPITKSDVCTLQEGKQVSIRYEIDDKDSTKLKMGQMWPQTDRPMLLFTQTRLQVGDSSIPVGAFSVYVIPDKRQWTLVINSNVTNGQYHPQQDLVRASMDAGQLSEPAAQPKIWFGQGGPNRCEFRFYNGKTAAFIELQERQQDTLSAAQH